MAPIYLLLFVSPQVLLFLYLRERLPLVARRWLAGLFIVFNIPWVVVAVRVFSGSLWGISRIPYIAPFIAWQFLGWIFCGLVCLYLLGKSAVWIVRRASRSRASFVVRRASRSRASFVVRRASESPAGSLRTTDDARLSRRQFLARAT
jgi:hypothetical protein